MNLKIQVDTCCQIEDLPIEIISYLGNQEDIHYFKTIIHSRETPINGLLRVGSPSGGLKRELLLREYLKDHRMISPLLKVITEPSLEINLSTIVEEVPSTEASDHLEEEYYSAESDYLEEEYYPEEEIETFSQEKLLILSQYPDNSLEFPTVDYTHKEENNLSDSLLVVTQICQFFRYVTQGNWCFVTLLPQYIQKGSLIQFYDLTTAYPLDSVVTRIDTIDSYGVPELAYGHQVCERDSSYVIGRLLGKILHIDNLDTLTLNSFSLTQKQIPLLWQILSLSLSPLAQNRLPLSQLLNLLVSLRKTLSFPRLWWEIGSHSVLGLSQQRLNNEDSYVIVQKITSQNTPLILAAVADGMGGLAGGEIASQSAITVLEMADFQTDLTHSKQRQSYLNYLVTQANLAVRETAKDGGTTISAILAKGCHLNIAHVGDSRIYLVRNSQICQISEDHSFVGMLVANGQITLEESFDHPDRSVLLRSLGSKPHISSEYIQTLERFGQDPSLSLENQDLLLICSDGVWDLLKPVELLEIFTETTTSLQTTVEKALDEVLNRGAYDNATLIALRINFHK